MRIGSFYAAKVTNPLRRGVTDFPIFVTGFFEGVSHRGTFPDEAPHAALHDAPTAMNGPTPPPPDTDRRYTLSSVCLRPPPDCRYRLGVNPVTCLNWALRWATLE